MGCEQSHLGSLASFSADIPIKQSKGQRRKVIHERLSRSSTDGQVFEKVKRTHVLKTPEDYELIQESISKHFLLFKLTRQERRGLAEAMEAFEADRGEFIFQKGTPASLFFIVRQGGVEVEVNGTLVGRLGRGESFGELALLYSSPRSASVKAVQGCVFWCLSQQLFLRIQREMVKSNYKLAKPLVGKLPIFGFLSPKQKDAVSYNMNTLKYAQGEAIFKQGDDAVSFFIIISGLVEILVPGKTPIRFKGSDSFGENCLKAGQIRSGTAVCREPTELLAISRQDLKSCLGDQSLEQLLFHNILKWSLRRSEIFREVAGLDEPKMIALGQFVLVNDGSVIVEAGQPQDRLYICLEGAISQKLSQGVKQGEANVQWAVGSIVNEQLALDVCVETFDSPGTLVKQQTGYVFSIPLKTVQRERSRQRRKAQTAKKLQSRRELVQSRSSLLAVKVNLRDLYVVCKLGEGQMGKVYLVEDKKNQRLYALKCIEKNTVLRHQMERFVKGQKQIMERVDNPFIVRLVDTYKDSHFVYFLLNYIQGGDFFDFLSEFGICPLPAAQFYFGCLLLGIQYLHKQSIVYRDLKPENAVLNSNGYLNLIDLGTAKWLGGDSQTGYRTFTIIGTPHYMAPEVMEAKGYSFSVDVWSLGIILYEMVCGVLPYGGYSDDPVSIYKEIEKNDLRFPKSYSDPAGKELIVRLLEKKPERRAVEDFGSVKRMDFFRGFGWGALEGKSMEAPVRPKTKENKWSSKSQYLLSYLQKQKLKMDKPLVPKDPSWDEIF